MILISRNSLMLNFLDFSSDFVFHQIETKLRSFQQTQYYMSTCYKDNEFQNLSDLTLKKLKEQKKKKLKETDRITKIYLNNS